MTGRFFTLVLTAVLHALAYASPVSSAPEFCVSEAWQNDELLQAMGARGVSCYAKMVCKAELRREPESLVTETQTLTSTLYPSSNAPSSVTVTQTVTDGDAAAATGAEMTDVETVYVTHFETSTSTETQTDTVTQTASTITAQETEVDLYTEVNTYTFYSTYSTVTDLVTTSTVTQFATIVNTEFQTTEITETNVVSTLTDTEFDATATIFTTIATQTLTVPTATAYTTIPTATFTVVETVYTDFLTVVTETDFETSTTVFTNSQTATQSVTTTVVTNTVTQTVATVTNTVFQKRSLPTSAASDLKEAWVSKYGHDHFHSACSCVVKQPSSMLFAPSYSATRPATVYTTTYEILTATAEDPQPVTYTETLTITKDLAESNSQTSIGTKTVTSLQTIQTTDSEGVTTTIIVTAIDDVDALYTDTQTSTMTIDVTTTVVTSVLASATSNVDATTLLSVTDVSTIAITVTATVDVTATETLQLTSSETDPATATEISSVEVSETVFDTTTTTESTTATSVTSVGTTQTVGETLTSDVVVGTETATVTTDIEQTSSVTATATATALPKTFHIQEVTGLRPGSYLYVLSSTSPTGRYIFFTTNVAQATVFTVNPLTGNLQDTSTGYDVYLTNSNAVIAVTQAYDPVTAATNPVSYTGFKCVPDASKKITCNNANNLNALYNCGAYLYAVTPTYNFAQCRTGAVTFAAVDVTI